MLKARESIFWLVISDDIWEAVESCGICQASSQASKPIGNVSEVSPMYGIPLELICSTEQNGLTCGGDYFRKVPNCEEISKYFHTQGDQETRNTEFGRPFVLKSDNGPCYTSRKFHDFLEFCKILHITSSLHYLQSIEFTKALMGNSKKLMEKSVKD